MQTLYSKGCFCILKYDKVEEGVIFKNIKWPIVN